MSDTRPAYTPPASGAHPHLHPWPCACGSRDIAMLCDGTERMQCQRCEAIGMSGIGGDLEHAYDRAALAWNWWVTFRRNEAKLEEAQQCILELVSALRSPRHMAGAEERANKWLQCYP